MITPISIQTALAQESNQSEPRIFADKIADLAKDTLWLRLLHLATAQTKVISPGFYLSANNNAQVDLRKELEVNLQQARSNADYRCKFPARDQWLRTHFPELDFSNSGNCSELESWRASQKIDSITLVYPDRNLQTSLGVFSHTFLKFNLAKWPKSSRLNFALGFAAEMDPRESLARMISWGIFGGYVARFSFSDYFTEVNRYGEAESRDIFEYDLNLTPKEIAFLLDHMWEIQDAEFHYYFLNGNCSYHLLTLLEIARPELDLTSHFNFVTIPSTSLRVVLAQNNLIGNKRWIPSKQTRQTQMLEKLSPPGRTFFIKWRRQKSASGFAEELKSTNFSTQEKIIILDLLSEATRWKKNYSEVRKEALNIRSTLPEELDTLEGAFPKDNPETAHGAEMIGASAGYDRNYSGSWMQLHYRGALHNMMDPPEGYFHHSTFEIGDVQVRYAGGDRQFENSTLTFFNAIVLQPWVDDDYPISWQAHSAVTDFLKYPGMQNSGGIGISGNFGRLTLYSMAIADSYLDKNEKWGLGLFAGFSGGMALDLFEHWRSHGTIDYLWPLQSNRTSGYSQGELQLAYSKATNWSMQFKFINSPHENSAQLETLYHY